MLLRKSKRYRNKKILNGANGQPCYRCGIEDGTIVAAHSNDYKHGKAKGRKADDNYTAYLCHRCHWLYDNKRMSQDEFEQAMRKTQAYVRQRGWA